jgi:acyl-coenzyme A synthetase/AMP-(fatty) acid ligase
MQINTVSIDTSISPAKIEFSPEFNVAVPFIDRHLQEGRKDKVIIRETGGEAVTYGQLAECFNQSGNTLKILGLKFGDRMLMMVKDSTDFFIYFGE